MILPVPLPASHSSRLFTKPEMEGEPDMLDTIRAFIFCLLVCMTPRAHPGAQSRTPDAVQGARIRQLIASLPSGSRWRYMMEHGLRGDGVHQPWMDHMREEGIRLAIFTVEFAWTQGGRKLEDWTLVREQYFRDYDQSQPVLDQKKLNLIREGGLQRELAAAALPRAKKANWVDYPSEERGEGGRVVYLADDEWLPVGLSPFFGRYERGTTPLMHAASLGDVGRIEKLLGEGADVNAPSPDGSTALIYAASSDDPAAVEALLKAGADVTSRTKDGGDALIAAAAAGVLRSVELLLKAGADPNSRDLEGESALSIAIQRHYTDVAKLLEQAGARK